jgi:hypothetical protein
VQWTLYNTFGIDYFELERDLHISFANKAIVGRTEPVQDQYTYIMHDTYLQPVRVYYRIAAHMDDGSVEYSPTAMIMADPVSKPTLTFDVNTGLWRINIPSSWQNGELSLFDLQGRLVQKTRLANEGHIDLSRPVTPGVYFISIKGEGWSWSDRIVR